MARFHYDILQIHPDASSDEIQHAYRTLALRYHPDRNASPEAKAQMAAVNEAYQVLGGSHLRQGADELTDAILQAARAVILRQGWSATHDDGRTVVFEKGRPAVRIVLMVRLTQDALLRISRQYRELAAVFAIRLDGSNFSAARVAIVDLMHGDRYGAPVPEGSCKTLLSGFL